MVTAIAPVACDELLLERHGGSAGVLDPQHLPRHGRAAIFADELDLEVSDIDRRTGVRR